jgi:hypothetical protein
VNRNFDSQNQTDSRKCLIKHFVILPKPLFPSMKRRVLRKDYFLQRFVLIEIVIPTNCHIYLRSFVFTF